MEMVVQWSCSMSSEKEENQPLISNHIRIQSKLLPRLTCLQNRFPGTLSKVWSQSNVRSNTPNCMFAKSICAVVRSPYKEMILFEVTRKPFKFNLNVNLWCGWRDHSLLKGADIGSVQLAASKEANLQNTWQRIAIGLEGDTGIANFHVVKVTSSAHWYLLWTQHLLLRCDYLMSLKAQQLSPPILGVLNTVRPPNMRGKERVKFGMLKTVRFHIMSNIDRLSPITFFASSDLQHPVEWRRLEKKLAQLPPI